MGAPAARWPGTSTASLGGTAFVLVWLSVFALFLVPGSLLYQFGWNYQMAGGNALEKLHPSTIFLFIAFGLHALQSASSVMIKGAFSKKLFWYLVVVFLCAVYSAVVLKKPIAVFFDTWLAPGLYLMLWHQASKAQGNALAKLVFLAMIVNCALGLAEFFGGFRLVPMALLDINSLGALLDVSEWSEWRSTALLNHPLNASLVCAIFFLINLGLILFERSSPGRILAAGLSFASMAVFGGRAAIGFSVLIVVLMLIRCAFGYSRSEAERARGQWAFWLLMSLPLLMIFVWSSGLIDPLLARVADDNGSASARTMVFEIFGDTSFFELLFGDIHGALMERVFSFGALYGVEISWLNMILNYGFVCVVLIMGFLLSVLRELGRMPQRFNLWLVIALFFFVGTTAVYFSSKTILVSQLVVMLSVFVIRKDTNDAGEYSERTEMRP